MKRWPVATFHTPSIVVSILRYSSHRCGSEASIAINFSMWPVSAKCPLKRHFVSGMSSKPVGRLALISSRLSPKYSMRCFAFTRNFKPDSRLLSPKCITRIARVPSLTRAIIPTFSRPYELVERFPEALSLSRRYKSPTPRSSANAYLSPTVIYVVFLDAV